MPLTVLPSVLGRCSVLTTSNPQIKLTEQENKGNKYAVSKIILNKAHNSVCIKIDYNKKWSPYLNDNTPNINKKCDYVILTKRDEKIYLIFIELKSSIINKDQIRNKFKATECFFDYCESIASCFYHKSILKDTIKKHVVFVKLTSLQKTPTRFDKQEYNNFDEFKLITDSEVRLKRLLK